MNRVFNHTRKNINRITLIYLLSLIPLILYGTYKNGVLLYLNKYVPLYGIFRPILFCLIPFAIYMLYSLIKERKLKLNIDAFYYTAIGIFMPPETSLLKYSIALLVLIPIIDLIPLEFNKGSLIKLILVLALYYIGSYSYWNLQEASHLYDFSFFDLAMGRSIGGMSATSLLCAFITFIILCLSSNYKKSIAIISTILYSICIFTIYFIEKDSTIFINFAGTIAAFIIFGASFKHSSYTRIGKIFYCIFLVFLTIFLNSIFPYEGAFISILSCSIISRAIDRIFTRKKNKSKIIPKE